MHLPLVTIIIFTSIIINTVNADSTRFHNTLIRLENIQEMIIGYYQIKHVYPDKLSSLEEIFYTVFEGPSMKKEYRRDFFDGWNNKVIYCYPNKYGSLAFDLYSVGPNGIDEKGKGDDITNWYYLNEKIDNIKNAISITVFTIIFSIIALFLINKLK